jgi:membrane protease YdiL (CAAX protease family)
VLAAIGVAALVAVSIVLAMRPAVAGTQVVFAAPLACYAVLVAVAIWQMHRNGTLGSKLRPRSGDVTFGALAAVMLYFGAVTARMLVTPRGSVREAWIMRVYLQIGDPQVIDQHLVSVSAAIIAVAALEEISWRGFVFSKLEEQFGTRRAWPATAVLYAAAHLPTVSLLADPNAGPNPLILLAALGCGLIWGLIVARTGRLPVAILSHALFTWGVTVKFPLWQLR